MINTFMSKVMNRKGMLMYAEELEVVTFKVF